MAITVLSWAIILIVFLISGITISGVFKSLFGREINDLSANIITGLVFVTVYAEIFSIFYKVGRAAFIILVVICAAGLIVFRKRTRQLVLLWTSNIKKDRSRYLCLIFLCLPLIIFGSYVTSKSPVGYDAYNYHIPTIRWLEEYGIVKGLGNLHTRFAYNPSFLCLQALFSFSWLYSASMHSVNGFVWVFMAIYSLTGLWIFTGKRIKFTDMLRMIMLLILFRDGELYDLSAPQTDFLPMCLTGYIFIKWSSFTEENEISPIPYGLLAILGLFSVTIKLSAGMLVFFAVIPLVDLIRTKQFKTAVIFMLLGITVTAPFFIRNIILSGYPVYPVYSIDLFDFDWKLPRSVIVSDNIMTKIFARSWGKGIAYEDYARSFFEWLKIWQEKAGRFMRILGPADIVLSVMLFCYSALRIIRQRKITYQSFLHFISPAGFLFLLFTAPSARFGRWWFYIVPVIAADHVYSSKYFPRITIPEIKTSAAGFLTGLFILGSLGISGYKDISEHRIPGTFLIHPQGYTMGGSDGVYTDINGYRFYYFQPDTFTRNKLNGYDGFPGTEWLHILSRIEMRGNDLSDGFRPKKEMLAIPYEFQGHIMTPEQLHILGLDGHYDPAVVQDYEDTAYRDLLLSKKIPDEELTGYSETEGMITYTIEREDTDPDGIHAIDGWAYLSDEPDAEHGEICIKYGDAYYLPNEIKRQDIADGLGLSSSRIGFWGYISGEEPFTVCIIDRDKQVIYH